MTSDFGDAVDSVVRIQALLDWAGIPNGEPDIGPITGKEAGAVAVSITAARAIAACRVWVNELDEHSKEIVNRRLAKRQEWYALAVWKRMCE